MLGKGLGLAKTKEDIVAISEDLGCHPSVIDAIAKVESAGFGWYSDGRLKILFEKHWFYKLTAKKAASVTANLGRVKWIAPKDGGYKEQNASGGKSQADVRYALLAKAVAFDENAAYQSISMGTFQIMGFNHKVCGFASAKDMFEEFCDSEASQVQAMANFMRGNGLLTALRTEDYEKIEQVYNGGGLNGAYAKKMRAEAKKVRAEWDQYLADRKPFEPVENEPEPEDSMADAPTDKDIVYPLIDFWNWLKNLFK